MKKLGIIVLGFIFVIISMTGCKKFNREGRYIEENMIAPTFAGTTWGMTPEEAFKALGTTEADWGKSVPIDNQSNPLPFSETIAYYSDTVSVYGLDNILVKLEFGSALDIGLAYVIVAYNNDEDGETIHSELTKAFGEPNGYSFSYKGEKQERWGSPSAGEIYTDEEWNNGKKIYEYYDEVNRRKEEVGIEPSYLNKSIFDPHDLTPICSIVASNSTKTFQFDGIVAAILKWDGKIHKDN